MDAAGLIDQATPEPVVVIGSLPPAGRDLDLLVRPAAEKALARLLCAQDFHAQGHMWVHFADCGAQVVELIPTAGYDLDCEQIDLLFAEALPIDGLRSIVRPAAHHRLLLTARRVSREARLDAKRRAAVRETPQQGWEMARAVAPAWGAETALEELEQALDGPPPRAWRVRSLAAKTGRYRRGMLVTFSGLDGSGKSTQAEGLARTLNAIGYPTVDVWTSLAAHPSLARVAAPVRALVGRRRDPVGQEERPPAGEDDDRLTRLRERTPWLQLPWVSFVATMNAWWQLRAVRPHLLRGRIVICDRYTLDSIVHLRYRYGAGRGYRMQLALIRLLSPRPLRSYLLDVSPETAYERNQEYTLEQVQMRARFYSEQYSALEVSRLDGEMDRDELCKQIALEVWSALRSQRDASGPAPLRALLAMYRLLAGH